MKFGEYLMFLRKSKGMTAQELGKRIGTTGQYITQTEHGKLKAFGTSQTVLDQYRDFVKQRD